MRRIAVVSILVVALVSVASAGEGVFFDYEVVIEGKGLPPEVAQGMGNPSSIRTWFQDDMFKLDFGNGLQSIIIRKDKGVVWMVTSMDKSYKEFSLDLFEKLMEQSEQQSKEMEENVDFKKTGRKKQIGRWNCYEVIATFKSSQPQEPPQKSRLWITNAKELDPKKLAETFKWDMFGQAKQNKWISKHPEIDGFPVQIISESPMMQGTIKSTMTLKKFQRKTFPKSIFQPPAGYERIEIKMPPGTQMPMPPQGR